MKTRLLGINGKLSAACLLLCLCGCGSAPQAVAPKDKSASDQPTGESIAEVAEPFSGLDSTVNAQKQSKEETPQAQVKPPVPKPTVEVPAPSKPSVPEPTAEQLKRWAMAPYERLQLLACRDSGKAGLLTSAVVIGDGETYVLAGSRLTAWKLDTDEPILDFSDPANEQVVKSFAAAPDGKWLASGDGKGNLQIWDLPDCKQRISKKIDSNGVAHVSISPDSTTIATTCFTGEVTIWDAAQLTLKKKFKVAEQALQNLLYVAPNRMAIAAEAASIWNIETGKQEHSLTTRGYHSTFALSPDAKRLAYSSEGKIEFWNIQERKNEGALTGSFGKDDLATFSPDGKFLVTASAFTIQIWDIASSQLVQVIDTFGWHTSSLNWLPKSSVLMIASQNGRVRFWGNSTTAAALGWKPLHRPLELPSKDSGEPAHPAQLMQVVDLRTIPKMPGATKTMTNDMMMTYSTPAPVEEAKVFYHYYLTRDGWSPTVDSASSPDAMNFTKQGFGLGLYFSKSADGSTQVNMSTSGNVDLRRLPKFDAVQPEIIYEADNTVMYRVKASLLDIETSLIRRLFDAGWTAYARLNSAKNEPADSRDMQFIRGATTLLVSIQRQPADPASYQVNYNKSLTTKSLPIPKDSGFIEFDGSTKPLMVASTAMTLEQTRDFYDKEMTAQGWLRRDTGKQFTEKSGWMTFIRGQCDVMIVLASLDSGKTQIYVGDGLENSSWQLQKVKKEDPRVAANGVEAADVPALNGWSIVKYDAEQKQIDFVAKGATTFKFAEAYSKELASRGWKTDGSGVKSAEYLLARFTKEKVELTLRATLRGDEIQASISGDGLLWTKTLPVAKQVIAYETWLRIHRYPAGLDLLDKYIAEMKTIAKE